KDKGTLTVGVLSQLPWLAEDPGNPDEPWYGPTWDQAKMIADELGVELVPVPVSHTTKVTSVQTGQVDISIAPLNTTEERLEVINMPTNSLDGQCFVALKTNTEITSVADLDKEGLKLAYPLGGAQEQ